MESQTPKRRKLDAHVEMPQVSDETHKGHLDSATGEEQTVARPTMKNKRSSSASAPFAGDAYHSSLFQLQVEEMLVEVKPNYAKRLGAAGNALRRLKTIIEAIPDRDQTPVGYYVNIGIQCQILNCYIVI